VPKTEAVMRVKLTSEQKIQVLNSRDIALIMQQVLLRENKIGRSKEHFWVVCLSNSNRILLIELISLGNAKKSIVDPTEIFSFALQKRAIKLIMVHNHPSGELQPSKEDEDITDRMYQVGLFLDVPVIDHLIISENSYYSFVDTGLLLKLSKSKKYVLKFKKEEERLKNLGLKKGVEIGRKEGKQEGRVEKAIEMAKIMKNDGRTIEEIMRYTKLSQEQILKL
jgi:DNA repair protein RadC